jgi:hypothetical protein
MANKMTQRDYFNAIIAMAKGEPTKVPAEDIVAFVNERISALDKKSANRKPTKTQTENEGVKAVILEVLGKADAPMTVTEVLKADERLSDFNTQKISALMTQLVKAGAVTKTNEKRVSRFAVAEVEDEVEG